MSIEGGQVRHIILTHTYITLEKNDNFLTILKTQLYKFVSNTISK